MYNSLIIVVDDDFLNRDILKHYLKKMGFVNISEASNGEEALDKIKEKEPELLITDYSMPIMNGVELMKELKGINPEIPIILQTAYDKEYVEEEEKYEDEFIKKPLDYNVLKLLVGRHIKIPKKWSK